MTWPLKAKVRQTLRIVNLGSQKRLKKKNKRKIRRKSAKGNATGKKVGPLPPKVMPLKLQILRAKRINDAISMDPEKIFLRSHTITVIKRAITAEIIPSQKTSYSFDGFYINDYKCGGLC